MKPSSRLWIASLAILPFIPVAAYAAETHFASINVGSDQYMAGQTVSITNDVPGDLNMAGGSVTVDGTVQGNLQAVGGTIVVDGDVRHNVRVAGGTIDVNHIVGGNLTVLGGTIHISKDAIIGGSVLVLGGRVTIDGTIQGDLQMRGGQTTINGTVRGSANLQSQLMTLNGTIGSNAAIAAQNMTFGSDAKIGGKLRYWIPDSVQSLPKVAAGGSIYDSSLAFNQAQTSPSQVLAAITFAGIIMILMAAVSIALILWASKTIFRDTTKYLTKQPAMSFFIGLLYFVLTPVVIVILMLTVIGIPVALALLAMYLVSILFAKVLTGIVLAKWIEGYYRHKWTYIQTFFASLGVYLVLKMLMLIPFVGFLLVLVLVLTAYGALIKVKYERVQKIR
ncbi:MAG TPA: hypothetical protein VHA78_00160 [Candidatus Peribacteraceae bacterium]|nr:hypothetical protein [Candidatus Peribacteraceae bacterium]